MFLEGDHWGLGLSTADNVAIYGLIVVAVVVVVRGWQLSRRLGGWAPFVVRAIAANLLAIIGMPVLIEVLTP